jgi:hypothetical protein
MEKNVVKNGGNSRQNGESGENGGNSCDFGENYSYDTQIRVEILHVA